MGRPRTSRNMRLILAVMVCAAVWCPCVRAATSVQPTTTPADNGSTVVASTVQTTEQTTLKVTSPPETGSTAASAQAAVTPAATSQKPAPTPGRYVEKELLEKLRDGYEPLMRPVKNYRDTVDVKIDFTLNQILALEEKDQILNAVIWTRLKWKDEFLKWDPADYDGLKVIYVNVDEIWRPDMVLFNSVLDEYSPFDLFWITHAVIDYNGTVSWNTPQIIKTVCRVKVNLYPFDEQACPLTFGSWAYNGLMMDITNLNDHASLSNFIPHGEWQVLGVPCHKNVKHYDCCPEPFPDITCEVHMIRKPTFYMYNLVFPTILFLVIGLAVFCLPPESGEKISLATTILLAMSVFLLILMETVPATSDSIPLLGRYIGATISLLTVSTLVAIGVVNVHLKGGRTRPPRCVRIFLFRCMARLLCIGATMEVGDEDDDKDGEKKLPTYDHVISNGSVLGKDVSEMKDVHKTTKSSSTTDRHHGTKESMETRLLRRILAVLQTTTRGMDKEKAESGREHRNAEEWKMVAVVLDRLFLWVHVILTALLCVFTLYPLE